MKIKQKTFVLLLVVSLLPVTIFASILYPISENLIKKQTLDHLDSTASLIESQINLEAEKQILTLNLITSRILLRTSLDNFNNEKNEQDREQIHRIIESAIKSVPELDSIYITDATGVVVASNNRQFLNQNHSESIFFNIQESKIVDFELETHNDSSALHIKLTAPLFRDDNKMLGYVVLEFDASDIFLNNHLSGLGETSEYIIAKRDQNGDALFITPPRHISDNPLTHIVPKERLDIPITQALLTNEGFFEDKVDYHEIPVLSVTKYIEKTDWGLVVKIDKVEAFAPINFLQTLTVLLFLSLVGISIVISMFFAKNISTRIKKIGNVADKIQVGNYDEEIKVSGNDEIDTLSHNINSMAKSLKLTITTLKEKELQILKQLEELKELDKRKEEFLSMVSHELKTPLVPILGNLEMLMEQDMLGKINKDQLDALMDIQKNIERLKLHLEDITTVSKLVSDKLNLKKESITVKDLLDEMEKIFEPTLSAKNIAFLNSVKNIPSIISDKEQLKNIFSKLIHNAITHISSENGRIEINAEDRENDVLFSVKDNGSGIPKEKQKDLFKKFYQIDTSDTRSHQGLGLGLAICKGIVEVLGGNIWIESDVGQGTTIYFTISKS